MSRKKYLSLEKLTEYDELLKEYTNDNYADINTVLYKTPQELTTDEVNQVHKNLKLENLASEEQVEALYKSLTSNRALRFYCIEPVAIVLNGVYTTYPSNSNVEVKFLETDEFEIIPTSDNSILALNAFPGALGTYYSWLEGVKQFSNILFDMNHEDMYSKWNQGNQGAYQVQYAQYLNCIFWSDNAYISELTRRTNYTLYYSSQLPLCYSNVPDNTFKAFYLAFNVTSDPNWGNKAYRDSFAKATWATQVFSYYGARTIGIFGHDDPDFNIVLPKDCRGLMCEATAIENAGTFDAINVTNFGAKSGSWRDAFRMCYSLRNLYIKNLKVNLNISWSPINYDSIYFIISEAANTNKITISVSPHTYNLLGQSDFELAASKNITIELLTTNYVDDRRLSAITINGDGSKVLSDDGVYKTLKTSQLENDSNFVTDYQMQEHIDALINSAPETMDTLGELATALQNNQSVVDALNEAIVYKADKIYVDEQLANIPAAAISDWQENDTESPSYIQNRTHWIEETHVEILPETTIEVSGNSEDLLNYNLTFLKEDTPCIVIIDGVSYESTARYRKFNAYEMWVIGNGDLIGEDFEDTHLPFAIFIDGYDDYIQLTKGNRTITLKIEVTGNVVHKIPDIYLPEPVGKIGTGGMAEIFNDLENNIASADYSHAEGFKATASGYASHAEGHTAKATGYASHAEGCETESKGSYAHAEGRYTIAKTAQSHAEGEGTIAAGRNQHVSGSYNIEDTTSLVIVGNGDGDNNRRNAYKLSASGDGYFTGDVVVKASSNDKVSLLNLYTKIEDIEEITLDEVSILFGN